MVQVHVDGRVVEYLDIAPGAGAAVRSVLVLVHGDGDTARDWRWIAPALAEAGHRVLAPSLPGHGASTPAPSYLMPDLAGWLGRFLDVLGVDSAAVGGNSIGGLIPVHLALQQPQRVQRLLLIGGSAGFGRAVNPLLAAEAAPGGGEAAIGMTLLPGGAPLRALLRSTTLFAQPWRVPPDWWRDQIRWGATLGMLEASVGCKRAVLNATGQHHVVLDRLRELTLPALLLWGLLDKVVPVLHGRSAARQLPQARLHVLPTSGHVPHVENPQAVLRPLLRFLASTDGVR